MTTTEMSLTCILAPFLALPTPPPPLHSHFTTVHRIISSRSCYSPHSSVPPSFHSPSSCFRLLEIQSQNTHHRRRKSSDTQKFFFTPLPPPPRYNVGCSRTPPTASWAETGSPSGQRPVQWMQDHARLPNGMSAAFPPPPSPSIAHRMPLPCVVRSARQ